MYAARPGIKPWRANRAGGNGSWRRLLAAVAAVAAPSIAFSPGARGGGDTHYTPVEVAPGDTLWSIASAPYPADDVRVRVDDTQQADRLSGPANQAGQG